MFKEMVHASWRPVYIYIYICMLYLTSSHESLSNPCFHVAGSSICYILEKHVFMLCCFSLSSSIVVSGSKV
jgi:hypothetical protein